MSGTSPWRRVTKGRPCPICERPDWCLLSHDGGAVICARVQSSKRCGEAGWLHRLRESEWRPALRRVRTVAAISRASRPDLAELASDYRQAVDTARLHALAAALGLSAKSLLAVGIGWAAEYRAWSFPMADAAGNVLGIRLRQRDGKKLAVRGGKEGLFLSGLSASGTDPLLVAEGPTDTAALLDFGFVNVVGRPSCMGGIKLVVELVQQRRTSEVVIVADSDEPGQRGANNLASVLVAYAPAVRVIRPPAGIKDARAWLQAGGTDHDIQSAIAAVPARRLAVRAIPVQKG